MLDWTSYNIVFIICDYTSKFQPSHVDKTQKKKTFARQIKKITLRHNGNLVIPENSEGVVT